MGIFDIFKKKSQMDADIEKSIAIEESLIKYFYEELIMSLITMSSPAEEQEYMIGIGCIGDEILEDFNNFYIERKQFYIDNDIFNVKQLEILDEFGRFLERYDGHDEDFYWDIEQLKNNQLWVELRVQSQKVIAEVFGKKYRIEIKRDNCIVDGTTIEHTKRKLVEVEEDIV